MNTKLLQLILISLTLSYYNYLSAQEHHHEEHEHSEEMTNEHEKHGDHNDHGEHDEHSDHNRHGKQSEHDDRDTHEEHGDHDDHHDHKDHQDEGDQHKHEHGSNKAIGPNKAITKIDKSLGLQLSTQAKNILEIHLAPLRAKQFKIVPSNLVSTKNIKGIYRYRNDFFKFIEVKIKEKDANHYIVELSSNDLQQGDQIVVNGVELLRVADIYSTDQHEYGHSH